MTPNSQLHLGISPCSIWTLRHKEAKASISICTCCGAICICESYGSCSTAPLYLMEEWSEKVNQLSDHPFSYFTHFLTKLKIGCHCLLRCGLKFQLFSLRKWITMSNQEISAVQWPHLPPNQRLYPPNISGRSRWEKKLPKEIPSLPKILCIQSPCLSLTLQKTHSYRKWLNYGQFP